MEEPAVTSGRRSAPAIASAPRQASNRMTSPIPPPLVVTPTATVTAWFAESVKVTCVAPAATAVMVNEPLPEFGETVATAVLCETAVNVPEYPVSETVTTRV
jgi:hypothetical protein